jgi:hypothetical protein
VPHAEQVVRTLARLGEAGHAVALAEAVEERKPPRDQLVRVALMADVEQEAIVTEVEDVMKSEGQFDYTQVRGQVAPSPGNLLADRIADLPSQSAELIHR